MDKIRICQTILQPVLRRLQIFCLLIFSLLTITACGGGSSSSSTEASTGSTNASTENTSVETPANTNENPEDETPEEIAVTASSEGPVTLHAPDELPELVFFQLGENDFEQINPGRNVELPIAKNVSASTPIIIGAIGTEDGKYKGLVIHTTIGEAIDTGTIETRFSNSSATSYFSISGSAGGSQVLRASIGHRDNPKVVPLLPSNNFTFSKSFVSGTSHRDVLLRWLGHDGLIYFGLDRERDTLNSAPYSLQPSPENRATSFSVDYPGSKLDSQLLKIFTADLITTGDAGLRSTLKNVEVAANKDKTLDVLVPPDSLIDSDDRIVLSVTSTTLQTDGNLATREDHYILPPNYENQVFDQSLSEEPVFVSTGNSGTDTVSAQFAQTINGPSGLPHLYIDMLAQNESIEIHVISTAAYLSATGTKWSIGIPSALSMLPDWQDDWNLATENIANVSAVFSDADFTATHSFFDKVETGIVAENVNLSRVTITTN